MDAIIQCRSNGCVIPDCALGILAGGRASRLGGAEKGLLDAGGRTLLARVLDRLASSFGEVLLSANRPGAYAAFGLPAFPDRLDVRSPVAGLHALLGAMKSPRLFLVAVDLPGASARLAERLARESADVVLPVSERGDEPLHAVYSRACGPAIERAVAAGRAGLREFHDGLHVIRVPAPGPEWRDGPFDPYFNVNTPGDLARCREIANPPGRC